MNMLIVDPDANRQRQLRTILASLGYKTTNIDSIADLNAALATLQKKRFDCCFLAMTEPRTDSYSVLKAIRAAVPTKAIPVIVFGSDATRENVLSAVEAGASSFLAYPFT